jgi:hypothetical protein
MYRANLAPLNFDFIATFLLAPSSLSRPILDALDLTTRLLFISLGPPSYYVVFIYSTSFLATH